jgi:membrane associated rhomboid family serine protease
MQNNLRPAGFNILPPVVKNLLIINGLCWLLSILLYQKFEINLHEVLGLHLPESTLFRPHQLVTHLFFHEFVDRFGHVTFLHIFSNMFALWMFGSTLENFWGPKRFLTYYLVTGLGAAVIHLGMWYYETEQFKQVISLYLSNPGYDTFYPVKKLVDTDGIREFTDNWSMQKNNPRFIQESIDFAHWILQQKINVATVGASGAVFGVLLAFGMLFPNTALFFFFIPVPIKAKYVVLFYGLFELYQGIQNNPGDNVGHFAHLGGMLFGFILIKYWNKRNRHTFY